MSVFEVEVCQVRGLPGSVATLAGCLGDPRCQEWGRGGVRGGTCQGGAIERDGTDGGGCEILYAFSGTGECDSGQGRQELAPTTVGAAAGLRPFGFAQGGLRRTAEAAVATWFFRECFHGV